MSADGEYQPSGDWSVRSIVTTMFPLLIALSLLEMGPGYVLESLEETYLDNPTLLVLVPVMIAMGGNLGSITSSRLSTRLHLGTLEFSLRETVIWTNVAAVFGLALTIFTAMGIAAYGVRVVSGGVMTFGQIMTISFVSGMLLTVLAVGLSVAATYASYRLRLDPDDTTIPIVTNLCDVLGVLILTGVAIVVL